ncbi:MAG: 3-oxo-5-alpha-steroid 4-dehydrogenase [Myxococcota bacterium]|nr:3-oxo-5-alpha-steroid 4-dehydrogenase [Myxococcota bacterium]
MNDFAFFTWFMIIWTALAVIVSIALFFVPAPYGKFTRQGWGPTVHQKLGWIAMESPAVVVLAVMFAFSTNRFEPASIACVVIWEMHYLYRTVIFPMRMRTGGKRMTAITVLFGILFNLCNGYLNGFCLFYLLDPRPDSWLMGWRFVLGFLLFFGGFGIHLHSDMLLRGLRQPGQSGYRIPRGGLFKQVSSANYFGELVQWAGWAIATWTPAGFIFLIWTAANLVPRAWSNHQWYRKQFPEYPKERRAIIPFLF